METSENTQRENDDRLQRQRHPETQEQMEIVSQIFPAQWPVVTPRLARLIDQSILRGLRGLDYFARQKLWTMIIILHHEQSDERPESYKGKQQTLYGLVSLIDQIEAEIKEEAG